MGITMKNIVVHARLGEREEVTTNNRVRFWVTGKKVGKICTKAIVTLRRKHKCCTWHTRINILLL